MVKNVGGREAFLKDGKPSCIMLERTQRKIIKDLKGDLSMAEFVRMAIDRMGNDITRTDTDNRIFKLEEKLREQSVEIAKWEKQEAKRIKVDAEQLAYITKSYIDWETTSGLVNNHSRFYWAQACTKGLKIGPEEALAYLQAEGIFSLDTI